jgi:putative transposase
MDHPLWGYRRVWAYLRFREDLIIGKNRVARLMKENDLLVTPNFKLKAKRCSNRRKPRAKVPNQFWGIDMTKILLDGWGWIYLHLVLDWSTKEIVGYSLSSTSKSADWLDALNLAVNSRFPKGIHQKRGKPKLISDNGSQPTSHSFMQACATLGIRQIFTTWNNPKGNADTERVFRTLKEDLVWTNEWHLPFEFQSDLDNWINCYNTDFPHQSLRYLTPAQAFHYYLSRKQKKEVFAIA